MSSSKTRVAFLGPLASFSHQAAVGAFGDATTCDLQPKLSFADAFAALQSHAVDYAVIPFENSTNGSVVQTLDLLADRRGQYADIVVCGEHYLTVHQCLLMRRSLKRIATPARFPSVRRLYTHPQAWGQCERFLSTHFRGVERQDTPSTSKAAAIVAALPPSEEDSCAAIASCFAAEVHGEELLVAAENIEDLEGNTTRFLVLGNKSGELSGKGVEVGGWPTTTTTTTGKRKTLISFEIDHNSPGALADALVIFKNHGLNLTSINSRPGLVRPWQYIFFVECERTLQAGKGDEGTGGEGDADAVVVGKVMRDLEGVTMNRRNLGTWSNQLK